MNKKISASTSSTPQDSVPKTKGGKKAAPAGKFHKLPTTDHESKFPIVGIGASAGGLAAFEEFFSGMPLDSDPGMAFVLVQHLAPDHKSILTELVQRYTKLQVFEVVDGVEVQNNCAYIIPPNRDLAFINGHLHLLKPGAQGKLRLPIDYFFRSLAQDQHERGADSDRTAEADRHHRKGDDGEEPQEGDWRTGVQHPGS